MQKLWNRTHQPEEGLRTWRRNLGRDHPTQHAGHAALHEWFTTVPVTPETTLCNEAHRCGLKHRITLPMPGAGQKRKHVTKRAGKHWQSILHDARRHANWCAHGSGA